jgi:hypothetical protein
VHRDRAVRAMLVLWSGGCLSSIEWERCASRTRAFASIPLTTRMLAMERVGYDLELVDLDDGEFTVFDIDGQVLDLVADERGRAHRVCEP